MNAYSKIHKCRICGNHNLLPILDLGIQVLTGVFPHSRETSITRGPIKLVKCHDDSIPVCGLLQLEHSYSSSEMYGENYGYRSGLNPSMVSHLHKKVNEIKNIIELKHNDLIIDIGSNDGTTLKAYDNNQLTLVGIDPTGTKFKDHYPSWISLIPDFFSAKLVLEIFPTKKAKVITSFSMFYDLNDPTAFMQEIESILADDGVWVFEQSYMPSMLEMCSYDTICHEHLEYYSLSQIKWMADRVGLKIIDVSLNDTNGGSFSITCVKALSKLSPNTSVVELLAKEFKIGLNTLNPYIEFAKRTQETSANIRNFFEMAKNEGKRIYALGASTKGNVILQYCNITSQDIIAIGEVNADKFSRYTPGSLIPIIPEAEIFSKEIDYLLVLPWHFRDFFMANKKFEKFNLVFPLPNIEIVKSRI